MAVMKVEIKDFLVFKGELEIEFSPGVNVLLGGNGTGKTTLMRNMHGDSVSSLMADCSAKFMPFIDAESFFDFLPSREGEAIVPPKKRLENTVYIPEKDILEHAKGLLTFIENKQTGFSSIYRDVLIRAQDTPTINQSEMQKSVGQKVSDIIGGTVAWNEVEGAFYTIRTDGRRIPFANEASGFKKVGFLGLLVACGQLDAGSVLFWDEPENSLNPVLVPKLVEILLELAKNGSQIFIATHDYNVARYFDIRKDKSVPVLFHNLSKTEDGQIKCDSSPEYLKVPNNLLEKASEELFDAVVDTAMEVREDE